MRGGTHGGLPGLTGLLYEAVLDPAAWETALAAACEHLQGAALTLVIVNVVSRALIHLRNVGYTTETFNAYRTCYAAQDPRWHRVAAAPARQVYHADWTPFANGHDAFCRWHRQSAGHAYFAGVNFPLADDTLAVLFAEYRQRWGEIGLAHPVERIGTLLPQFEPAVRASAQTAFADPATVMATAVVNRMRAAAVVLDDSGRVTRVNDTLAVLLEDGDLVVEAGSLRSTLQSSQNALEAFVNSCLHPSGDALPPAILLWRRSGKRPYVVRAHRSPRCSGCWEAGRQFVTLFITDSTRGRRLNRRDLAALFRLTERQAELAALLGSGYSLLEAAQTMGIKEKTARAHLEYVLRKTNTSRQSQLVSLLLAYRSPW